MKLSELYSKEIINVDTGENLGIFGDCDLLLMKNRGNNQFYIRRQLTLRFFQRTQKKRNPVEKYQKNRKRHDNY